MKKFKNIYIEITNICNLSCSFCPKTKRELKAMTVREFSFLLERVKNYTEYIYLHVIGEPLLNIEINEILSCCDAKNAKIKLTTNGVLLRENLQMLAEHASLKAVNISLSCLKDFEPAAANDYLEAVFFAAKRLSQNGITTILRTWTDIKYFFEIKQKIFDNFCIDISLDSVGVQRIADHLLFDIEKEFIWPINSFAEPRIQNSCLGLRKQIAILCDGTVVPCCLDSEGILNLGNIFSDMLPDIISTKKALEIAKGFANSRAVDPFCQTCTFRKMPLDI